MELTEVLREQIMDIHMEAKDKAEVLDKLSGLLLKDGAISSKEVYINDVLLREKEGPTGLGNYIAIPHGKSSTVKKTSVAFAKLKNPVEWETLDGNPVKIIFLFAVPDQNSNKDHLKLLSQLASVLAYDDSQQALLEAESPAEVVQIFKSKKTSAQAV